MGLNRAREIDSKDIPIEEQLKSHLTTKLPTFEWLKLDVWLEDIDKQQIPLDFIPLAKDSIQRYWDAYNFDKSELIHERIDMPMKNEDEYYSIDGRWYITAVEVVKWLRLETWLEEEEMITNE